MGDRVEQVHVAALAPTQPGLAAVDLGRHAVEVDAVGDGQVVRAVRAGDGVVGVEVGADAGGHRLLAGREVHLAWYQAGTDVPLRLLVGVVVREYRGLEGPDQHHRPVQVDPRRVVHGLTPIWLRVERSTGAQAAARRPGAASCTAWTSSTTSSPSMNDWRASSSRSTMRRGAHHPVRPVGPSAMSSSTSPRPTRQWWPAPAPRPTTARGGTAR